MYYLCNTTDKDGELTLLSASCHESWTWHSERHLAEPEKDRHIAGLALILFTGLALVLSKKNFISCKKNSFACKKNL